jgi:hypothetical protein
MKSESESWPVPRKVRRHVLSGKSHFPRRLVEVCQDLQNDRDWAYAELPPVQLLKNLKLDGYPIDSDELARTEWMWSRRAARFLSAINTLLWLIVALGTPLWLRNPEMGLPLLTIWAAMVGMETVRFVRWRRDYERSVARLVRISGGRETIRRSGYIRHTDLISEGEHHTLVRRRVSKRP